MKGRYKQYYGGIEKVKCRDGRYRYFSVRQCKHDHEAGYIMGSVVVKCKTVSGYLMAMNSGEFEFVENSDGVNAHLLNGVYNVVHEG